jgi:hypothetical protein
VEVIPDLPERGRGVIAGKEFVPSEVVCNYGGKLLSNKDGQQIYNQSSESAMGYMFKFAYKGKKYYRDATEEIPGHAGRLINHSKCHANVRMLYH